MPHFQWDAHGMFRGHHIRAGKYPREMPLYKEDMTPKEVKEIVREEMRNKEPEYDSLKEVPEWVRPRLKN